MSTDLIVRAGAEPNLYGAFERIVGADVLMNHQLVSVVVGDAPPRLTLHVATGPAGDEQGLGNPIDIERTGTQTFIMLEPRDIPPGARVAVRMSSDTASARVVVKMLFVPRPSPTLV